MGNVDSSSLDPVANPVTPGNGTFTKYQRIHITAMGGSSKIDNLKIWRTGALGGAATHLTNARTATYGGALSYVAPTITAPAAASQAMPTTVPATANLGVGGSLLGSLTAIGWSDQLAHQIVTNAADVAGSTSTMNFQYDEVA